MPNVNSKELNFEDKDSAGWGSDLISD